MKFEGKFEITPKEIADLVRELQSQPESEIDLDDLVGQTESEKE